MKKTLLIISLLVCYALSGASAYAKTNEESLDQIIAVVNDDVVTKSELNRSLGVIKIQIAQEHLPVPSEQVLQKQVMDQLINKKLQMQIAKTAGVSISDGELNGAIQRIADQNHMTIASLLERINHDGMSTADYKNEMREQMTLQKLQQQEVVSHITITPEEVTNFMSSKSWQNNTSKEYRLDDILVPISDTPSSEEIAAAKKHAQDIMAKINNGQNFNALAEANSGDDNALKGGDLGWRKLPEIPSAFAEQVVHLQPKEIAGPIQTANGFHIIRLADVRSEAQKQAAPNRKQIEDFLLQRKFEEAVQNWISKLRSQAFITLNVSENSPTRSADTNA